MAFIKCEQCGFENPEGLEYCDMCDEPLIKEVHTTTLDVAPPPPSVPVSAPSAPVSVPPPSVRQIHQPTIPQVTAPLASDIEYFVLCPESQTKTTLPNGTVTSFFCNGCRKEHDIDGFLWQIETRTVEQNPDGNAPKPQEAPFRENYLYLEEMSTHFRIAIDKEGGILGRYGKYGADFFQSRNMRTVSGEHCQITFEHNSWVLRHVSRTNQTKYDGMILNAGEPVLLQDGKILTLANTVSFVVRID